MRPGRGCGADSRQHNDTLFHGFRAEARHAKLASRSCRRFVCGTRGGGRTVVPGQSRDAPSLASARQAAWGTDGPTAARPGLCGQSWAIGCDLGRGQRRSSAARAPLERRSRAARAPPACRLRRCSRASRAPHPALLAPCATRGGAGDSHQCTPSGLRRCHSWALQCPRVGEGRCASAEPGVLSTA